VLCGKWWTTFSLNCLREVDETCALSSTQKADTHDISFTHTSYSMLVETSMLILYTQLSLVLISFTQWGMARLSWPSTTEYEPETPSHEVTILTVGWKWRNYWLLTPATVISVDGFDQFCGKNRMHFIAQIANILINHDRQPKLSSLSYREIPGKTKTYNFEAAEKKLTLQFAIIAFLQLRFLRNRITFSFGVQWKFRSDNLEHTTCDYLSQSSSSGSSHQLL